MQNRVKNLMHSRKGGRFSKIILLAFSIVIILTVLTSCGSEISNAGFSDAGNKRKIPGWMPALENQKAVYLITDIKTGRLYVGSATAQYGMLVQRWSEYISNGHGGNEGLKEIVATYGFDYVKENFQYSILENYNARMDDKYILKREAWWKDTLKTREFGLNKN